jgi:uncharacterized membrane protein YtjA (UPF0391 family)
MLQNAPMYACLPAKDVARFHEPSGPAAAARSLQVQGICHLEESVMLSWAIGFFILALVAAFFGFGGIASSAAGIAKVLLVLFVIGFIVSLFLGARRRP